MGTIVKNISPDCATNYSPTVQSGKPCTTNVVIWSPADLDSTAILAIRLNELRVALNQEESRRVDTQTAFGTAVAAGTITTSAHWAAIRSALETLPNWTNTYPGTKSGNKVYTWTYSNPSTGAIITDEVIEEFRLKINDAKDDCLCNCNYCTCNCNYCTCNCDYCTCNCNYCTCNCNYSCTCNCNYSDRYLKKNIIYI